MLPLFAVTLNIGLLILIGVLGFLGALGIGMFLWKKDDAAEELDKDCADAYAFFKNLGWTHVAEFLKCTLAEDRTGQYNVLAKMREMIGDPQALGDHLRRVTLKQVHYLMNDNMSFIDDLKKLVTNKSYIEEAERKAENDVQKAEQLLEETKLLEKIRLRKLEEAAAAAGNPASAAATAAVAKA